MRQKTLLWGFSALAMVALAAGSARADSQRFPVAFVDRPLTLPKITLAPEISFDATQLAMAGFKDPNTIGKTLQTNLSFAGGFLFGITENLEIRASIGTLQIVPNVQYMNPRVGATYRFVGSESFNMGIRAETTVLTLPGAAGVTLQASLPMLARLGSSARIDLTPGAPVTIQEKRATSVGLNVPLTFAFQIVEVIHLGASTSATITDFTNPGQNLVIPLGFFAGISLGSERPILELDPYFVWTDFARPGAKFDNDKVSIEKYSAGLTARLYLYL